MAERQGENFAGDDFLAENVEENNNIEEFPDLDPEILDMWRNENQEEEGEEAEHLRVPALDLIVGLFNDLERTNLPVEHQDESSHSSTDTEIIDSNDIPADKVTDDSWMHLPMPALENVLLHLNENDRAMAARTCKKWREAFFSPSLWRTRRYRFTGMRSNKTESEKAIGYARHLGSYLHHLIILCDETTFYSVKKFQRTMEIFLNLLMKGRDGNCQLRKFILLRLEMDRFWRSDSVRRALISTLVR